MSYTEEQLNFIRETIKSHSFKETTMMFNKKFKTNVTVNSLHIVCSRNKWKGINAKVRSPLIHPPIIHKLADFFYTDYTNMLKVIQYHRINDVKFYELVTSQDLIHRRDEFYSYFKNEGTADTYWLKIWDSGRRSYFEC